MRRYTTAVPPREGLPVRAMRDDARAALVTSANLTGAGLFENLELGLVQYDPPVAARAIAWFDGLWDAKPQEFKEESAGALLFPAVGPVSPREVYLRALLELLGADCRPTLWSRAQARWNLPPSRATACTGPWASSRQHHGVIYADGVGTGKTEIGLALVEEYVMRYGASTLSIVAPAQLVEYWNQRLNQVRLSARVLSYHQLAADEQLARPGAPHTVTSPPPQRQGCLPARWWWTRGTPCARPAPRWYRAMSRLLGGTRKDLVLLTATPINNGLWDLYHLVMCLRPPRPGHSPRLRGYAR